MRIVDIALAVALSCAACSQNDDAEQQPEAIAGFFKTFHASRYSEASARAAELDAAAHASPSHGRLAFDRALAHNWHVQEWRREPNQELNAIQSEARSLLGLFQTAYDLNPEDPRVGCFLGLQQVGAGRALQDLQLLKQGLATLDKAVREWPEFNLFCLGLAYDYLPADDPDYELAVEAALSNVEACVDGPLDRNNPDITPYVGQATTQGPKSACWNNDIAPHNAEGFYLWVGDLLVKQGNVQAAQAAYRSVQAIPEYESWPYRALLEDRLSSDLELKAALYRDSDPDNDPEFGGQEVGRRCTVCHAASADE